MRKTTILICVFVLGLFLPAAGLRAETQAEPPGTPFQGLHFSLKLYGGFHYFGGGDLNIGIQGVNDAWTRLAASEGLIVTGDYKPVHLGMDFGGDLIFHITPSLGISIGSGYFQASRDSELLFEEPGSTIKLINRPKVSFVPVRIELYYFFPVRKSLNFYIHAGGAYYLARFSYLFRLEEQSDWIETLQEATSNKFGFQGGLGFEIKLLPSTSFFFEGQGCYARFGGFEGSVAASNSLNTLTRLQGRLYFYQVEGFDNKFVPSIQVHSEKPSGSDYRDVREAILDFGGFSLRGGFLFRF